VKKMVLTSI